MTRGYASIRTGSISIGLISVFMLSACQTMNAQTAGGPQTGACATWRTAESKPGRQWWAEQRWRFRSDEDARGRLRPPGRRTFAVARLVRAKPVGVAGRNPASRWLSGEARPPTSPADSARSTIFGGSRTCATIWPCARSGRPRSTRSSYTRSCSRCRCARGRSDRRSTANYARCCPAAGRSSRCSSHGDERMKYLRPIDTRKLR